MTGPDQDTAVPDPALPIIDAHHHLWAHIKPRYLIDEFRADLESGHNVVATVFAECGAMYRRTGPEHLRTVGEAEFVAGVAAMSDSGLFGTTRMCAAYVGGADFMLGERVEEVLEALAVASGGRLRGIRGNANWDASILLNTGSRPFAPPGLMADARFRAGVARLANYNLVYDAWQYFPQLPELCGLADALPRLPIAVNHCGGMVGFGPYTPGEASKVWRRNLAEVARRPNTVIKLGGLARRLGVDWRQRTAAPTPQELAQLWGPYIETCIELFGPDRCMFESNSPPDKDAGSYRTIWSAWKLIAAQYSAPEKARLFHDTAARVYRI